MTYVADTESDAKSVRMPLSGERLQKWEGFLAKKKVGQQDALYSLIDWIVEQETLFQSMVLGQLEPDAALVEEAIRRLEKPRKKARIGVQGEHGSKRPGQQPGRDANQSEARR